MYHSTEYSREFWNAMRGKPVSYNYIESGKNTENGNYRLPYESGKKFAAARKQENIFRQIATVVKAPKGDSTIWAFDNEPVAKWIDKDNPVFFENTEDFQRHKVTGHQLGSTILLGEKRVYISNYMPEEVAGAKPIAFGDFRYFWIIDRWPFEMCRLTELFAIQQQVGFIGHEYLDAKLIRPDAVHVMQITA